MNIVPAGFVKRLTLFLCCTAIITSHVFGEQPSAPLKLALRLKKPLFKNTEEIPAVLKITNTGPAAVSIMHWDFADWGESSGLKFRIEGPEQKQPLYIHREQTQDRGYEPVILELIPGAAYETTIFLKSWYQIRGKGRYKITATLTRNMSAQIEKYKDPSPCFRASLYKLEREAIPNEKISCAILSECWSGTINSNTTHFRLS